MVYDPGSGARYRRAFLFLTEIYTVFMGKFQPGKSGNPGGRPPGSKNKNRVLTELLDGYVDRAVEVLSECLSSKSDKIKLTAAIELLDRFFGKPAQVVANLNPENLPPPQRIQYIEVGEGDNVDFSEVH